MNAAFTLEIVLDSEELLSIKVEDILSILAARDELSEVIVPYKDDTDEATEELFDVIVWLIIDRLDEND